MLPLKSRLQLRSAFPGFFPFKMELPDESVALARERGLLAIDVHGAVERLDRWDADHARGPCTLRGVDGQQINEDYIIPDQFGGSVQSFIRSLQHICLDLQWEPFNSPSEAFENLWGGGGPSRVHAAHVLGHVLGHLPPSPAHAAVAAYAQASIDLDMSCDALGDWENGIVAYEEDDTMHPRDVYAGFERAVCEAGAAVDGVRWDGYAELLKETIEFVKTI